MTYNDILENLTGAWGIPFQKQEDTKGENFVTDCKQLHINITIEERDTELYYIAQHGGLESEGFPPHEQIVEQAVHTDGRILPALKIQYENEGRLDDNGEPLVWYLFMLDKDRFTWSAAHANLKGFTPIRTRCAASPSIS